MKNSRYKFRAWVKTWDDSDGEMLQLPMQVLRFDFEEGWVVAFGESGFWVCECYEGRKPHQFELMQFTGLHDKNGVKIYEGDILRDEEGFAVCSWCNNMSGWGYCLVEANGTYNYAEGTMAEWAMESEVVGNIYEHPELLEAQ